MRQVGLLCASRWHATADEYAKFALDPAIAMYHTDGLEATLTCYSSIDAQLDVFVAKPDGEKLSHYNAEELGVHLEEMLEDGASGPSRRGLGDPPGRELRRRRDLGQALLDCRA